MLRSIRLAVTTFVAVVAAAASTLVADPAHAAAFETTSDGIAAARAAGIRAAIGVARDGNAAAFSAGDADLVINDLGEMLERNA